MSQATQNVQQVYASLTEFINFAKDRSHLSRNATVHALKTPTLRTGGAQVPCLELINSVRAYQSMLDGGLFCTRLSPDSRDIFHGGSPGNGRIRPHRVRYHIFHHRLHLCRKKRRFHIQAFFSSFLIIGISSHFYQLLLSLNQETLIEFINQCFFLFESPHFSKMS